MEEEDMSTLRLGIPGRVSLAPVLMVLAIATSACNGGVTTPGTSSTAAPLSALPPASAAVDASPMGRPSSRPLGQTTNTFSLSNGSFTVTASNGDLFRG